MISINGVDILNIRTENMFYLTQYNEVNKVHSASVCVDNNDNLLKHFINLDLTKISQKRQYFQTSEKKE